jgi:hypothetical protein
MSSLFRAAPGVMAAVVAVSLLGGLAGTDAQAVSREVRKTTKTSVDRDRAPRHGREVNVDRRNVDIDRRNVRVDRDVNINVDVDDDRDFHPFATAVAVGAAVSLTAAVIGSLTPTLPPQCSTVIVNGLTYHQCGPNWYQPQYAGTSVQYVVVAPPR